MEPAAHSAVCRIQHNDSKQIRTELTLLSASSRVMHKRSAREDTYNIRNQHVPAKNTNSYNYKYYLNLQNLDLNFEDKKISII